MSEREPDELEPDPDQPPGPIPEDEGDVAPEEPDLGDFEGNLNA